MLSVIGRRAALTSAAPHTVAALRCFSGVVAGQDTPVNKDEMPDNLKSDVDSVVQAPEGVKGDKAQPSSSSSSGGEATKGDSSAAASHPTPSQDPYSGGDPTQQEPTKGSS
ncbi:hypothetical protein D9Q98_008171 [Chlorella vulgaris]|uniref:Uncharacterized protein n=1 Tax=Chlorella vulgaris TaxID=3077 RepID=A0A9D4TG75_CHLVU|nr:hypothetical protein D9Q98_008171 [Chlorella vulgaris]